MAKTTKANTPPINPDLDNVVKTKEKPKTKLGKVTILGNHVKLKK